MFEDLLKKAIRGFLNAIGYTSRYDASGEKITEDSPSMPYPKDYLSGTSIVFSGDFQSDVSTVNNDVRHYDNATFEPRFQEPRDGQIENGWWNPDGGAIFRFLNCQVTRCLNEKGEEVNDSALLSQPVTNADDRSGGKMVDLDPQMQMTSEIWGVRIRMVGSDGKLGFEGKLRHTGFRDLQLRQFNEQMKPDGGANGQPLGASFCTVIENVKWGDDLTNLPVVKKLKDETEGDKLRIQLNTFGYYYSHNDGRFSMGRVIGTVAPYNKHTPLKFAATRRLYATGNPLGYTNFAINTQTKKLRLDLGMSIPISDSLGTVHDQFRTIGVAIDAGSGTTPVGAVSITDTKNWLHDTGGIAQVSLSDEQISQLESHPLVITLNNKVIARESTDGWYVRADQNVQRLDPEDSESVDLYVYRWGQPSAGQQIHITLDPKETGQGGGNPNAPDQPKAKLPAMNVPAGKVSITPPATTDSYGKTTTLLTGVAPGNPRIYIDGQIYMHSYAIEGVSKLDQYWNDKIIVHLRDAFTVPDNPTWDDVKDIWIQFGNLYPIMSHHIADFNVAGELLKRREILLLAFTRDINDPMYMPVTRDMSAKKMATLIKWLETASDEEKGTFEAAAPTAVEREYPDDFTDTPSDNHLNRMTRAKAGDMEAIKDLMKDSEASSHSSTQDHE